MIDDYGVYFVMSRLNSCNRMEIGWTAIHGFEMRMVLFANSHGIYKYAMKGVTHFKIEYILWL